MSDEYGEDGNGEDGDGEDEFGKDFFEDDRSSVTPARKSKWQTRVENFEVFPHPSKPKSSNWWLLIYASKLLLRKIWQQFVWLLARLNRDKKSKESNVPGVV